MHRSPFRTCPGALIFLALVLSSSTPHAQVPATVAPSLTLDWIVGPEGRAIGRVPSLVWLNDGSALMLDTRRPKPEQTIEHVDPTTGARRPALDTAKAMANLRALLPDTTLTTLPWPAAFDVSGARAAYVFSDDVFVLDLASASFVRLRRRSQIS